jgi:hypothetical protein
MLPQSYSQKQKEKEKKMSLNIVSQLKQFELDSILVLTVPALSGTVTGSLQLGTAINTALTGSGLPLIQPGCRLSLFVEAAVDINLRDSRTAGTFPLPHIPPALGSHGDPLLLTFYNGIGSTLQLRNMHTGSVDVSVMVEKQA